MTPTIRSPQLALLAALTALGCASTSTSTTKAPEKPVAQEAPKASQEMKIETAAGPSLSPIYFDTDEAVLRADARSALKTNAEAIVNHPEWGTITIEGHCDERGSEEYNLALGERRAEAAKRFLMDLGVSAARLGTVTFGESRPAVPGHSEAAWRYNRRSELAGESLQSASR
jgi:peptidoglycan-associated lipoprotein